MRFPAPSLMLPAACMAILISVACSVLPGSAGARPSAQAGTIAIPIGSPSGAASVSLAPVARGLRQPVFLTHAGDGSGRLFILERNGAIRIVQAGQLLSTPFLNVRNLITTSGSEQGLLGLAFHPRYAENGVFFIYYTANDGANTVARYRVSPDPNVGDAGTAEVLIAIPDSRSNHNGGMLAFGPDGYLYIGTGDGGGAGDPDGNGQRSTTLLRKLLRIDVDRADSELPYAIPPGNPFAERGSAGGQVWAYGLRNPWRFSFDRQTSEIYIADVGQNEYEEIHVQPAESTGGENYGWSVMEGNHCFPASARCNTEGLVPPVAEYSHAGGDCSITGGYVYRGTQSPSLQGAYLFGDFCSGRLWSLRRETSGGWSAALLLDTDHQISSFGEDEAGEVYLLSLGGGAMRITAP